MMGSHYTIILMVQEETNILCKNLSHAIYNCLNSTDCGGMVRNFRPESFWNNVRSYERCKTSMNNSKDYFGWAQRSASPQDRLEVIKKSTQVKNMLTRLCSPEPKHTRSASLRKPIYAKSHLNQTQQQFGRSVL